MGFFKSVVRYLVRVTTFAPWSSYDPAQYPLPLPSAADPSAVELVSPSPRLMGMPPPADDNTAWPAGKPFAGCKYPRLEQQGWKSCHTPQSRDCWLQSPDAWRKYDIHSDYEYNWPQGIVRHFNIEISDKAILPDGYNKTQGKVINGQFPGPMIEACWGDVVAINVTNKLTTNGTTIHWHGIRQLNSNQMDGVNAVTQCPIAQDNWFVYKFRLTQYGHTWYHSHYSIQYGDGVLGPLLIHGPQSADWDEEVPALLVGDWGHNSAFADFSHELTVGPPEMQAILLGGVGNYTNCDAKTDPRCQGHGSRFELNVTEYGRYLLHLVNSAVATTFVFSIDRHKLKVISADFVPIEPYETTNLLIGIGQRYSVVVLADAPNRYPFTPNNNFWIRTVPAEGCNNINANQSTDYHLRTGVIRYTFTDANRKTSVHPGDPVSQPWEFLTTCLDEPYNMLVPIVPWSVAKNPANDVSNNTYVAGLTGKPIAYHGNVQRWDLGDAPLWLDFEIPTILHLDNKVWDGNYSVVDYNYDNEWVYLVVTGKPLRDAPPNKLGIAAAHPIHLHGHDFALLAQGTEAYDDLETPKTFKFDNPPRRDVALLPRGGYLAIAFRSDNPGSWLLHCHIAWHASSGLALQILERQGDIVKAIGQDAITDAQTTCRGWNAWRDARGGKLWTESHQDDSGI